MKTKKQPLALVMRHGETSQNNTNSFRGRRDQELDEDGVAQAEEAAEIMAQYPIKRIVSSPLQRSRETAEIVNKKLGLKIEQEGRLMAFDMGFLVGEDKDEFHEVFMVFMDNPELEIPRGESLQHLEDRVADYMEPELRKAKPGTLTLYVCHSSPIVVLNNLLNGERKLLPGLDEVAAPGSVCAIYEDGEGYSLDVIHGEQTSGHSPS